MGGRQEPGLVRDRAGYTELTRSSRQAWGNTEGSDRLRASRGLPLQGKSMCKGPGATKYYDYSYYHCR